MARKGEPVRTFNVSVVGLSGTEKEKGQLGVGKSCLCNRFIRPVADDYYVDHISVLSQTDFSGRVVNNDHFLYWGDATKTSDEGIDFHFQVIEQTEFIDDASFQPFKGGKMEPYVKRCSATKLTSAEKLMYICKNQLGIEKEYELKVLPDGKINIDGFLCVFDVSVVPNRSLEKQLDFVTNVLNNLQKSKKPVVVVTTKNDEAEEMYVKELERLVSRKEFKGSLPVVETAAHENVNVDLAFVTLAQLIDRTKGRTKIVPFAEAARARKEVLDVATEAYQRLVQANVTDYKVLWSSTSKKIAQYQDFVHYKELFGIDTAHRMFKRHIKKLKDECLLKKVQGYLEVLPEVLHVMFPDISSLGDGDWLTVQEKIKNHPDFNQYFIIYPEDVSWMESNLADSGEARIPFDVLDTGEAETVYKNHINALQAEQKRLELPRRYRKEFKRLLEEVGYVTPGKPLSEVKVLFMGRECFEALSEQDALQIYEEHQKEIVEKAKHNFQEVLLEHADLFYQFKSIAPTGTVTQEDIKEITDALQEDSRYKALDRLDQDRKLMLFQHLGFVHCPIREHCPAFPNCMDSLIERILATKAHRPSSWNRSSQWVLSPGNNQLNLVLLGVDGLAEELSNEIRAQCDEDEYELDNQLYSLDYRIIDGDVSLPQNSFRTADFLPHGCFCVYSNPETFEYVRESLEKTLLSNLEQDDRLPFQGLPIVILFAAEMDLDECDLSHLREEGQSLADSLQCPFIDVSMEESIPGRRFRASLVASALRSLLQSIQHRAGFLNVYQTLVDNTEPDIRVIMCMLCGDPYSVENVLGPLLNHQCCFLSGDRSITLETFLGDSKRRVEVIISSYHGANAFREELVHGFILVYSTKRKASLATLSAFSTNIPNLPIQILAVTDTGGANAFFSSDLSHILITEGNSIADALQAHFMTLTSSCQQKTAFYTPFFKEVWDKKPEIEQAFNMEDPGHLDDSGEGTLERPPARPIPPPRLDRYRSRQHAGSNDGSGSEVYERLPTDGSLGDDLDDPVSPTFPDDRGLSPSDDSDIYSRVDLYNQENGEHLVKPSQIKNRRKLQQELFRQSYPSTESLPSAFSSRTKTVPYPPESELSYPPLPPYPGSTASPPPYSYVVHESHEAGSPKLSQRDCPPPPYPSSSSSSSTARPKPKPVMGTRHHMFKAESLNLETTRGSQNVGHLGVGRERGFQVYPPPTTPPEPAPPDHPPRRLVKASTLPTGSHTSLEDITSDVSGSRESLATRDSGWVDDSVFLKRSEHDEGMWSQVYSHHAFTTGRRRLPIPTKSRSKGNSQTMKVKDAIPGLYSSYDGDYSYTMVHDSVSSKARIRQRREKGRPPKLKLDPSYGTVHDDESSVDVSSPREFGMMQKLKEGDKTARRKEKQKKEDEKQEKRRQKEEEKQKKLAEKEKEREKKKQSKQQQKKGNSVSQQPTLDDLVQSEDNAVPLFLEKCVLFIEEEGLDSEGIYRVPGNRAHVDLLFQKFEEEPTFSIHELDIPVNAVATALKDFFSKRLPPVLTPEIMNELEDISDKYSFLVKTDRSCRLLALQVLLKKLPSVNFQVLKFVFQHFVKVSENCKLNSMDSKNLAICWWPTLLPFEFSDMGRFEQMRPHLEDIVQTMIDQYPFLFCGKEEVVMV